MVILTRKVDLDVSQLMSTTRTYCRSHVLDRLHGIHTGTRQLHSPFPRKYGAAYSSPKAIHSRRTEAENNDASYRSGDSPNVIEEVLWRVKYVVHSLICSAGISGPEIFATKVASLSFLDSHDPFVEVLRRNKMSG
jgi:hypothetical protein